VPAKMQTFAVSKQPHMALKIFTVDSFTNVPFKGNPAAVCITIEPLKEMLMQQIAKELGLSETAFVVYTKNETYPIRYFSPQKEIPLCGHATLAAAKVLWMQTGETVFNFITVSGVLLQAVVSGNEITMQFPVYNIEPISVSDDTIKALGIQNTQACFYSPANKIIMIEIADANQLAALKPDFTALKASQNDINGVLVTAASASQIYDYEYRYFWPWAGTNEDPVTGGVQTFLAKYWQGRLNKTIMYAFQSSERTGKMKVALKENNVFITGEAVVMLEGNFINY
jgi:PhzF family phenazine biosynthesis protein